MLLAFDFGARAADGTMQMQVQRPALVSALSRAILIPSLLRRGSFPSGGSSPVELDPLHHQQFGAVTAVRESALVALQRASNRTTTAFRRAVEHAPERRIVHAYFGKLPLLTGWRLLSAHTRHHAALLLLA